LTGFHREAPLEFEQPRKRVAVIAAQSDRQTALLGWLEHVFPVRFELDGSSDARTADGALVLDPGRLAEAPAHLPRLLLARSAQGGDRGIHGGAQSGDRGTSGGIQDRTMYDGKQGDDRSMHRGAQSGDPGVDDGGQGGDRGMSDGPHPDLVALANDGRLARALRARNIPEHAGAGKLTLKPQSGREVLARVGERPVWWQSSDGKLSCSLYPLAELGEGQTLREHLRAGAFMGVLPLLHFLGELLGDQGWSLPAPRAAFVIDDPNLHWVSYGFLKYRELAEHASRHGYHLAFATVPLDGWRLDARAVGLMRDNPTALSLLIHGNDHVACELGGLSSDRQAEAAMAQALRRIAALERRCGLSVARVMAPPHGACSEAALRAMFRLGFEAACISRPYPWRDGLPAPTPLAGWHPAELVCGGIPVAPRQSLSASREDLAFRALLGQPLILYGHHGDFADGLDLLAQAAADIDDLGEVRWGGLGSVAGGAYATRRLDDTLLVQMHARRVSVQLPEGIETVRVLAQEPLGGAGWQDVRHGGGVARMSFEAGGGVSEPLPVSAAGKLDLELVAERPLDPTQVRAPRPRAWPLIRRLLVEGRDRLQPLA
jgi:hypothetical protein